MTWRLIAFTVLAALVMSRPAEGSMVLCNTLDSQTEVEHSVVGLNGKFFGGSFVPGVFQNAYSSDVTQPFFYGVQFPKEVVPTEKGTIEFWAKLTNIPSMTMNYIRLIGVLDPDLRPHWEIGFAWNDGAGGAGIYGRVGNVFFAASGDWQDGHWSYPRILGAGQEEAWHHYALVWDKDGIAGVGDGTRKVALFLDGRLESRRWEFADPLEFAPPKLDLGLIHIGEPQGSVAIDNLKIWNVAKTDFSDRSQECVSPIIPVTIDIKPGSYPNSMNPKSHGVIPVALLSTNTFDATTVDPSSVKFGPAGATEAHGGGHHSEDVNGDRRPDLVLHFRTQDTGIVCGDTSASLTGATFSGQAIEGSDSIRTVGCKPEHKR